MWCDARATRATLAALALLAVVAAGVAAAGSTPATRYFPQPRVASVTLAAAGDVMFDRGVRSAIAAHGADWPLSAVADVFRGADIGFVNLETALTTAGERLPGKGIWFRSDPSFAGRLRDAGVNIVSLANNHALDYGRDAFAAALDALEAAGVAASGGGRNAQEARRAAIIRRNGITVAFLSYSELAPVFWSWTNPQTFMAGASTPGIPGWNVEQILSDIRRTKSMCHHVIVSFHWGDEYSRMPAERQTALGRAAIDAGASVVLGHHPHVLQPVEVYRSGVIFYSLGNFVFDQKKVHTRDSLIARLVLTPYGVDAVQLVPAFIEDCRPKPLHGLEARAALNRFVALCDESGGIGAQVVFADNSGYLLLDGRGGGRDGVGAAAGATSDTLLALLLMGSRTRYAASRRLPFPGQLLWAFGHFGPQ